MGDQGCDICRRVAIEQDEVETECFASESQNSRVPVAAANRLSWRSWDRCRLRPNVRAHRTLDDSYGS